MKKQAPPSLPVVALLAEELKCTHLFNTLATLGFDHSFYRPDLSAIILQAMGITDETNTTFDRYYRILQQYSRHLPPGRAPVIKRARQAYRQLQRQVKPL